MLRWALRFVLFRFLPRRFVWVLTVLDAFFLVRALGRRLLGPNRPGDPRRSRAALPARTASSPAGAPATRTPSTRETPDPTG
ncbi:MAG TPA: hypothetical protein VH440_10270 [Candidatus Limnocylindrales bacterium]|jgi:hypothetical protein